MTDEIRITRRVALPDKYEFYERTRTSSDTSIENEKKMIQEAEEMVRYIRKLMEKPTPEISPKTIPDDDIIADLHDEGLDASIVEVEGNVIRLKKYLKDKDLWTKYNSVFKDAGYKWIGAGKDSRWEI